MNNPPADRPAIRLKPGHDKRVRAGHPWAFANEIQLDADARLLAPGTLVRLLDGAGQPLGTASFNLHSLIAARILSNDPDQALDRGFFTARLQAARDLRERFFAEPYYRLVHAEADRLPGIVIDRYGAILVIQINTAGAERLLPELLAAAQDLLQPAGVVLRNDAPVRSLEGLESYVRLASGTVTPPIELRENQVRYLADPLGGQKTGWFFDLREPRALIGKLAGGARVLDAYCHTGAFALQAAVAGAAEVIGIDRAAPALELAAAAAKLNQVAGKCRFVQADAFAELERLGAQGGQRFDLLIADPPSFVKAKKELKSGVKGYRKLTRLATRLVAPGGFLFIGCCSHHVPEPDFAEEVSRGLVAAGRGGRIVAAGGAGADHPIHPQLPESAYLKWRILQVD